jgi:hypothetical protein
VRIAQLELMSSSPTRADKMAQIEGGPHGAVRAAIMRNPSVRRTVASILDGTAISRYAVDAANAIGAAAAIAINNDARGHVLHDGKRVTASDFQPKVWEFDADGCESVSTCNPPSIRGPVDPPGQESEGSSYPSLGDPYSSETPTTSVSECPSRTNDSGAAKAAASIGTARGVARTAKHASKCRSAKMREDTRGELRRWIQNLLCAVDEDDDNDTIGDPADTDDTDSSEFRIGNEIVDRKDFAAYVRR